LSSWATKHGGGEADFSTLLLVLFLLGGFVEESQEKEELLRAARADLEQLSEKVRSPPIAHFLSLPPF
jgi:hypothetical protein